MKVHHLPVLYLNIKDFISIMKAAHSLKQTRILSQFYLTLELIFALICQELPIHAQMSEYVTKNKMSEYVMNT